MNFVYERFELGNCALGAQRSWCTTAYDNL